MTILGIETSCDDTGIAIIEGAEQEGELRFRILAHNVSSQASLHAPYGGIYPSLAKREHEKNLPLVLSQALKEAKLSSVSPKIDAISVTVGPGLSPCLWSGVNFANNLAAQWSLPLIPANHIEGHILVSLLREEEDFFILPRDASLFPMLSLIISGGHTQLVLAKAFGAYEIIGETRDDAAGECFDKTARILGLSYPGGPAIAQQAELWRAKHTAQIQKSKFEIKLPRPMEHTKDYDFSFSGLKTAVLYDYQSRPEEERKSSEYVQEMAYNIQEAIADVLVKKTMQAARTLGVASVVLGGGVAANTRIKAKLSSTLSQEMSETKFFASKPSLSGDNGLIPAIAGLAHASQKTSAPLEANPNLRVG
ncbi:MAG: tRNA (adenosine(37)-N6)-threonylcarbamoyltransferase complex transferase subunit TsaD [bacterium]|nr:tRNA (adenosine(37)-N6)-threonylcarbamoyltransferase complex transferase subunit TsaD [bacterium]